MENLQYVQLNSILVEANSWIDNPTKLLQIYSTVKQKLGMNFITKVIKFNYNKEIFKEHNLKEDQIVFVSRYVDSLRTHEIDNKLYKCVPLLCVLGIFEENIIDFEHLRIVDDKILIEKVTDIKCSSVLENTETNIRDCVIGKVLKNGNGGFFTDLKEKRMNVNVNDIILFMDNISTDIQFYNKNYSVFESHRVIGRFIEKDNFSIDNLELLNGRLILKELEENVLRESKEIITCEEIEDIDYTSKTHNKFRVIKASKYDKEIKKDIFLDMKIKDNDIVIANKHALEYVTINNERYYTTDVEFIDAIVR